MAANIDLLELVEAAYQVDEGDDAWIRRLAHVAHPMLDAGFGLAAFEFFRPDGQLPKILQSYHLGIPEKLAEVYPLLFDRLDPEIRQRPFRMGPCISGSQMMGMRKDFRDQPQMKDGAQKFGMYDSIWITAAEPSGRGIGFHAGRPKITWITSAEVARWGRIAAHLSTAVRLRHRLNAILSERRQATPDAVLDPSGKVHDASGPASTRSAQALLRHAVLVLERARGPMRLEDPDKSLINWRALVAGRWSLVDQVEHDGRRYILARENEPKATGPAALTEREKQVVGYAKLGHHNKLIAYELGVADSTVRVLLARAAAKLGVRSRADLLRALPEAQPESSDSAD